MNLLERSGDGVCHSHPRTFDAAIHKAGQFTPRPVHRVSRIAQNSRGKSESLLSPRWFHYCEVDNCIISVRRLRDRVCP